MVANLEPLAKFIKVHYGIQEPIIDSIISRLHYRFTASILILGFLISLINYRGNPIDCTPHDIKLKTVINAYCWISSTFTLPSGLRNENGASSNDYEKDRKKYEAYYQWIPYLLIFQGILFSISRWIWKNWENDKINKLSEGLRGTLSETSEDRKEQQSKLVECFINTRGTHSWYALGYYFTEFLNFFTVVGNIYLTNRVLGGNFVTYGIKSFTQENSTDSSPYIEIFPRLTKCTFRQIGASGVIQLYDSLCVLAMNVINEKIFLFLWWWFFMLAIISGVSLIYNMLIVVSPALRRYVLFQRFNFKLSEETRTIISNIRFGDYVLLHLLGQNISMVVYTEVLEELSSKLGNCAMDATIDVTSWTVNNQDTRRRPRVSTQKQSLSLIE